MRILLLIVLFIISFQIRHDLVNSKTVKEITNCICISLKNNIKINHELKEKCNNIFY